MLPSVDVLTWHNDTARTGENLAETALTPTNVNSTQFGKKFSVAVDGYVYAQPLVKTGLTIGGVTHDVVFVATEGDSVYALDAGTGSLLWHDGVIPTIAGYTTSTVPNGDVGTTDIVPQIGITGTPVIDAGTSTLYVVAKTKEVNNTTGDKHYVQRLHALDLTSGAEKFGGPVVIADTIVNGTTYTFVSGPSVPGTGAGSVNGVVNFNSLRQNQRPALLLDNGTVYIAWASHGDNDPYHGWVLGYSAASGTLQLVSTAVYNDSPNGTRAGIWMSGSGLTVDPDNASALYFASGNGTFDANTGGSDYGDSVVRLAVGGNGSLTVADYFTPSNQSLLERRDQDQGSGGVLALPDTLGSTAHPHLLVQVGKTGNIYLIDRDNMGKISSRKNSVVQELSSAVGGMWASPTLFNNGTNSALMYFGGKGDFIKAFSITSGVIASTAVAQSSNSFAFPGTTTSVSANGITNGIVWALDTSAYSSSGPEVLYAYNATNLSTLYNSNQAANSRDVPGAAVKFAVPTVANGMVYVGTETTLTAFGLLGVAAPATSAGSTGGAGGAPSPAAAVQRGTALRGTVGGAVTSRGLPAAPLGPAAPLSSDLGLTAAAAVLAFAAAGDQTTPGASAAVGAFLLAPGPAPVPAADSGLAVGIPQSGSAVQLSLSGGGGEARTTSLDSLAGDWSGADFLSGHVETLV
jgi:hypothetical protein